MMRLPRLLRRRAAYHSPAKGVEAAMRVPSNDRERRVISIVVAVATMLGTFGVVMTQGALPAAAATSPTWTDNVSWAGSAVNCGNNFQSLALPVTTTSLTTGIVIGGGGGSGGSSGNAASGPGASGGQVSGISATFSGNAPAYLNGEVGCGGAGGP
jgi:hypothetical protein